MKKMASKNKYFALVFLIFALQTCVSAQNQAKMQLRNAYDFLYEDPQKAISLANAIIRKTENHDEIITGYVIIINAYSSLNQSDNALRYAFKALDMVQSEKDIISKVRILGLIGEQFQVCHFNDESRFYLDQAQSIISDLRISPDQKRIYSGNIDAIKGNSYKDDLDCNFAIDYYNKAIKDYLRVKNNSSATNNLCLVYIEKSECLIEQSSLDSASIYIAKAQKIADRYDLKGYKLKARYTEAKNLSKRQNYKESNALLLSVLHNIGKLQDLHFRQDIEELLVHNYFHLNDFPNYRIYSKFLKKSRSLLESAHSRSNDKGLYFILKNTETTEFIPYLFLISAVFSMLILVFVLVKRKDQFGTISSL